MSANDKVFTGSIPDVYETLMVPLVFVHYANEMAQRVASFQPMDVLETAAGTGAVTRALAPLLSDQARYTATDLNPPMLAKAEARLRGDARITWQQADAMRLPFDAAAFDAVICQFGVMFFPDRVAAYREARRVLRPGGRFHISVWGSLTHNDFARLVHEAVVAAFPDNPPEFFARTPHGHHDVARIEDDLRAAGFADIGTETLDAVSSAATPLDAAAALCQGTPLRGEIEAHGPDALQRATALATEALRRAHGDGPVSGAMQAHFAVGRA